MTRTTFGSLVVGLALIITVAATAIGDALQGGSPAVSGPSEAAAINRASASIGTPDAADPRGGPPWAMMEYSTADGRNCGKPGRRIGHLVGSLSRTGELVGTDIDEGGVCIDVEAIPESEPLSWQISSLLEDPLSGEPDPVTFIWGLARPEVRKVLITTQFGKRIAPVGPGHTFIAVVRGQAAPYGVTLTAVLADQSSTDVVVPPPPDGIRQNMLHPPQGRELDALLDEAERRAEDPSYHRK
jgi:hypothetical protein